MVLHAAISMSIMSDTIILSDMSAGVKLSPRLSTLWPNGPMSQRPNALLTVALMTTALMTTALMTNAPCPSDPTAR